MGRGGSLVFADVLVKEAMRTAVQKSPIVPSKRYGWLMRSVLIVLALALLSQSVAADPLDECKRTPSDPREERYECPGGKVWIDREDLNPRVMDDDKVAATLFPVGGRIEVTELQVAGVTLAARRWTKDKLHAIAVFFTVVDGRQDSAACVAKGSAPHAAFTSTRR